MANDDIDILQMLERVPHLGDAQLWEIARRCRIFRARPDGEDQTVHMVPWYLLDDPADGQ